MLVEIVYWAQDTRNLTYVNGCGYNTLYLSRKTINTDFILELPSHPNADPTGHDVWSIPYKDSHTHPILTTRLMVEKLKELCGVKSLV